MKSADLSIPPDTLEEGFPSTNGVDTILAGDRKAFEQLVIDESPRLYRVILRVLGEPDEAQNILQETFLQAWQRLDTFRGDSRFTTWLYAIGINLAKGSLRKSRRLSSLDDQEVERLQPTFSKGMFVDQVESWNPLAVAEVKDCKKTVHEAIAQLPEDYRTVVILRDIEEQTTEDVARILGITEGAVRVRLHRARQALRKLLDRKINKDFSTPMP